MTNQEATATPAVTCSFCGKDRQQALKLVAGPGSTYICDDCVVLSFAVIAIERDEADWTDDAIADRVRALMPRVNEAARVLRSATAASVRRRLDEGQRWEDIAASLKMTVADAQRAFGDAAPQQ